VPPSFSRGSTVKLLVLILSVMFATPVYGERGDDCSTGTTWMEGYCTILCDAITNAGTCNTGDAGAVKIGFGRHRRIRSLAVELQNKGTCTAGADAKVYSKSLSVIGTEPWHYIASLDLDATDDVGTSMIAIDGIAAAPMAFIKVVTTADCTISPTIVLHRRGALEND